MAPAKSKTQKMSLGDFLGDQSLGSWADEMEDMPVAKSRTGYGGDRRAFSSAGAFGGDRGFGGSDRGGDRFAGYAVREQLPLPTKPPYTAHLGNLSFDATEGDIQDFFTDCEVTSVRIVEDKMERKPKGFGYVEFGTLDGLKKALELNGTQFQGRNIRISVADPPKDRPEHRVLDDWTRKGPLPDLPGATRRVSDRGDRGGYRNFDDAGSDAGSARGERRRPPFEGDGKVRDFNNWERKGPLSPVPPSGPGPMPEGGRLRGPDAPVRERKMSPSWGEGRSQDGSRPPRREFQERPPAERQPTAPELDNQWRSKMRPDPPAKSPALSPEASTPSSPIATPAPAVRPKLNLAKRTVSEAEPATASGSSDSKASPFGAARPIDTAAREKEIEEKRQIAIRQKKEQDEKAREEKRAKEATAKTEKDKAPKEAAKGAESKENGGANDTPASKNYEILRRMDDEVGATDDAVDAPANGEITEDKAVKPKEPVKAPAKAEGSWRRQPEPEPTAASTTENLEDDGWSTVPAKSKNNRKGGNAARALAS